MVRGVPKSVIDMLRAVPLLAACNRNELREIANLGAQIGVAEETVLTRQGGVGREFFLVIDGKARCTVDGTTVAVFGPGDFFGEMALLERGPRQATVVAEEPTQVLILDGREFDALLGASPSIARKLLKALAERERVNTTARS